MLVHTGQHYDRSTSTVFFEDFGIRSPARWLEVGSGNTRSSAMGWQGGERIATSIWTRPAPTARGGTPPVVRGRLRPVVDAVTVVPSTVASGPLTRAKDHGHGH